MVSQVAPSANCAGFLDPRPANWTDLDRSATIAAAALGPRHSGTCGSPPWPSRAGCAPRPGAPSEARLEHRRREADLLAAIFGRPALSTGQGYQGRIILGWGGEDVRAVLSDARGTRRSRAAFLPAVLRRDGQAIGRQITFWKTGSSPLLTEAAPDSRTFSDRL